LEEQPIPEAAVQERELQIAIESRLWIERFIKHSIDNITVEVKQKDLAFLPASNKRDGIISFMSILNNF
jgi:hypothetical protein